MKNTFFFTTALVVAALSWGTPVPQVDASFPPEADKDASPWFSGISVGHAFGTKAAGGTLRHDFILFNPHVGRALPVHGGRSSNAAKWFLIGEAQLARRHQPGSGWILGAAPLLRRELNINSPWTPFLEGGIGVNWTNIGHPDLSGRLQFSPQGGTGFHYPVAQSWALSGQYRFIHYSNGGNSHPNAGINVHCILLGISRFH